MHLTYILARKYGKFQTCIHCVKPENHLGVGGGWVGGSGGSRDDFRFLGKTTM